MKSFLALLSNRTLAMHVSWALQDGDLNFLRFKVSRGLIGWCSSLPSEIFKPLRKRIICICGCIFGSEDHWEEVDARRHALWWLWRPILDLQALEQDGHVNVVSVTGWLAESFRRCRFSAAAVFLPSSKLSAAVLIVPLHSSLSSASASHSLWSMPACVSCRFNWSLKRLRGAPRSRLP